MKTIWIIGDQLSLSNSALARADKNTDRVLIVESRNRSGYLRYHQKRLVLVYSALRHFAADGWQVDHHPLEETPDYESGLRLHCERFQPDSILVAEPNDWPTADARAFLDSLPPAYYDAV